MKPVLLRLAAFSLSFGVAGGYPSADDHRGPTIISDARDVDPSTIRKRDTDRSRINNRDTDRSRINNNRDVPGRTWEQLTPEERKKIEYYDTQRELQERGKRDSGWYEDSR